MSNKFYIINRNILTALHKYIIDKYKDTKIFADKINISNGYLSLILSGNRDLSKKFRLKFEMLEGFPIEDLLKEGVAKPQAEYKGEDRRNKNRRGEDIKRKIVSALDTFEETNMGTSYLQNILECLEGQVFNYLNYKRRKHS